MIEVLDNPIPVDYVFYLLLVLVLFYIMRLKSASLYPFIATWWLGSVMYALILNQVKLPATVNPWTFSVVTTTLILLVPGLLGHSTELENAQLVASNKVIGVCNMLNIWSVVLGNLLVGGSVTYYLKLGEPLVVFIVEIIVYGKQSLTFKHAKNGMISIILLTVFYFTSINLTPMKVRTAYFFSYSTIIVVISIISVSIKVVLGAKRNNSDDNACNCQGYTLFLFRSSFGFKFIVGFTILALFIDQGLVSAMVSVLPALIIIAVTQNLYNYASVVVNLRKFAGEYVNGKIVKRTLVLVALTLNARYLESYSDVLITGEVVTVGNDVTISAAAGDLTGTNTSSSDSDNAIVAADSGIATPNREQIVIFGAIGRHNFGDLLMAEVFTKNLGNFCDTSGYDVYYADVLPRDMREYGGRDVRGITEFMNSTEKTHVVHVGGETSGCDLSCATTMIQPDINLPALKTHEWKRFSVNPNILGYIIGKYFFKNPGSFVANTIGGSSQKADDILQDFEFVSTRDFPGVKYKFAPDSVVTIKEVLEDRIKARKPIFSNYVSVQFRSGENVDEITKQLVMLVKETNRGIVFFRAGAATHHDSLKPYQTVLENMRAQGLSNNIHIFSGLDIWDITSLIAYSELSIGTSLHVRIIAFAFSVPRVTFSPQAKHIIMIQHWDFGAMSCNIGAVAVQQIYQTSKSTMECGEYRNEAHSTKAVAMYKDVFKDMILKMNVCT